VTGTRVVVRLGVIVRALILVADEEADGCTEGHFSLDTRLQSALVGLVTLQEGPSRKKQDERGGSVAR
jgi:hypothetical protein